MVDIGDKPITRREAVARAVLQMQPQTEQLIRQNQVAKGDVLQVARIAAIMAAKETDRLIPLCHSLPLESTQVEFQWIASGRLEIRMTTAVHGKTGVEMEAMVGVSLAALTVYDMVKAVDREMTIEGIELLSKSGGTRGDFQRASLSADDR
ncbi:MAG: cyclic pyranopterin monophosphate synthase accessory protein [Pirellulaceae bacterium]|nr:MAG: cyclic pyranopterin monophosphate synthase accessory protein [Pirellulaceae bacterium]